MAWNFQTIFKYDVTHLCNSPLLPPHHGKEGDPFPRRKATHWAHQEASTTTHAKIHPKNTSGKDCAQSPYYSQQLAK